jgi:hypothetical protein
MSPYKENVLAVKSFVALEAFPESGPDNEFAVIVAALKLPRLSRATMALAVLALVAVVALLETFPAVEMVASLVSAIAALNEMSAFTIPDTEAAPARLFSLAGVTVSLLTKVYPVETVAIGQ